MGITERKEREKQELKDKIIDAATELFQEYGFEKTSIRMIADKIEYSPATIYLYFEDKNELFFQISEKGFSMFFEYFSVVRDVADPLERIQALGRQYLKFAVDHPGFYDLMFVIRAPMETHHTEDKWQMGERSHGVLLEAVAECLEKGYFKGYELHALALMIWSGVHGLATLYLRDRLRVLPHDDIEKLLEHALKSFNQMLTTA